MRGVDLLVSAGHSTTLPYEPDPKLQQLTLDTVVGERKTGYRLIYRYLPSNYIR